MKYFKKSEFQCKCCRQLPEDAQVNVEALADNVLDPTRERYGKPIKVNSGYRCPRNNSRVGGAKQSQHLCLGDSAAADICTGVKTANMQEFKEQNKEIARQIVRGGRFDQLILENVGENDLLPAWVHVSWKRKGANRGQILKKVAGKAGYAVVTKEEICKLLGGGFKKVQPSK